MEREKPKVSREVMAEYNLDEEDAVLQNEEYSETEELYLLSKEELVRKIQEDRYAADLLYRLNKDLRKAARMMNVREARYLVDLYYQIQKARVAATLQLKQAKKDGEPLSLLAWSHGNALVIEKDIKTALGAFAKEYDAGQWLQGICGIGPVLSAGFLSTLDIRERVVFSCTCKSAEQDARYGKGMRVFKPVRRLPNGDMEYACTGGGNKGKGKKKGCQEMRVVKKKDESRRTISDGILLPSTAGSWWRFAGLDPTLEWKKGKIRPWNARLKVLCFKAGDSFWRSKSRKNSFYGKVFEERKLLEIERNESGMYEEQALFKAEQLKKNGKTGSVSYKEFYTQGKLPPAHIQARARRKAVKLFLSHYHDTCYKDYYGTEPPIPYAFTKNCEGNHGHYIAPPVVETSGRSLRELLDH